MRRLVHLLVLSCGVSMGAACGADDDTPAPGAPGRNDAIGDPGAAATVTPASRCDKYCNACRAEIDTTGCVPANACVPSAACGPDACSAGDPSSGAGCTPRCGDEVARCVAECLEEYRATAEVEACLDRDGDWPALAATHGVAPGSAEYVAGLCYALGECGDFW